MALTAKGLAEEQAWLITVSLIILAAVATALALSWTRPVMVPLVLATFVYYLVSPIAELLESRLRFPRWASTLVTLLLVAGGLVLLGLLVTTGARGLAASADIYREKLLAWGVRLAQFLDGRGIDISQDALVQSVQDLPMRGMLQATAGTALTLVTNGTLVLIFVVFLLLGRNRELVRSRVFRQIDREIRRYLVVKFALSAVTGALVGIILSLFGLELALVFGVLAFFLNFIPSVGSIVATILPLPLALVQFDTAGPVIAIFVLTLLVQFAIGNVIDPKLMGKRLDLSPVTILAALVFWGLLWGIVGMLLAAPLTAILRIVLSEFQTTRVVADLLAGRLPPAGQTPEFS
ncbi:MAG: AI-2E family transporter [Gemmatimonadaceae bacterium]